MDARPAFQLETSNMSNENTNQALTLEDVGIDDHYLRILRITAQDAGVSVAEYLLNMLRAAGADVTQIVVDGVVATASDLDLELAALLASQDGGL